MKKKITTKRVLLFLLLLIKLAIFPHIGILFIVAAANAAESDYRLVIMTEPDKLNRSLGNYKPGDRDYYFRSVCGTREALAWGKKTIFKNRPWVPRLLPLLLWEVPCDSKIVGTGVDLKFGKNSDRMCTRISGCAINLDAVTEEEYCPTCVWPRENLVN